MLENFFDIRKDSKELFEGLEIMENPALCKKWMNQWPVIFLSLKDVDGLSYEEAENAFVQLIGREACIFRKNCASVPEERSAIPLQTEQSSAG